MKRNAMFFCVVTLVCFLICGCAAFKPFTGADGQAHTQFGDTALTVAQTVGVASNALPIPYGAAIGGIAGLIGLIGTSVTAIAVARRRGGVLGAVIQGVEEANKQEVKDSIRRVAGDLGYGSYLRNLVAKLTRKV